MNTFHWQGYHQKKDKTFTWVEVLPFAVFASKNVPGVLSSYSPHQIVFGRNLILTFKLLALSKQAVNVAAEEWFQKNL